MPEHLKKEVNLIDKNITSFYKRCYDNEDRSYFGPSNRRTSKDKFTPEEEKESFSLVDFAQEVEDELKKFYQKV